MTLVGVPQGSLCLVVERAGWSRGLLLCCIGPCRHSSHRVNTVKHCTMPLGTARSRHGPGMKPYGGWREWTLVLLWVQWGKEHGKQWAGWEKESKGLQSTTNVFKLSDKKVPVTRGVELRVLLFLLLRPPPFLFLRYKNMLFFSNRLFLCYCW